MTLPIEGDGHRRIRDLSRAVGWKTGFTMDMCWSKESPRRSECLWFIVHTVDGGNPAPVSRWFIPL